MIGINIKQYNIGYKPIPKTATTTIKTALACSLLGKENCNLKPYQKKPGDFTGAHGFFGVPTQDITDTEFKFVVIRDPLERFISVWNDRVIKRKELSKQYI